ncbi:MAG: urease accessory protein UreD [Nitrospinales bacterium]
MTDANADTSGGGWRAALRLGFSSFKERTILDRRQHEGPLMVQRPFYPEPGGVCHVYMLHPPGGVVGGDRLRVEVDVGPDAHALVTTPAAGKFYRSAGAEAQQRQILNVSADATLEWFPLENIFYSGARVETTTRIHLSTGSRFIGWDILCLGRPACGERFENGRIDQRLEIWRGDTPLRIERLCFAGNDPVLDARWGMAGYPVIASMVCVTPREDLADKLREIKTRPGGEEMISVTRLDGLVICRYLGRHVEHARQYFIAAWEILRLAVLRRKAVMPRIWST